MRFRLCQWFAAAVFDVEACQLALSEDEMAVSKNAMRLYKLKLIFS